VERRLAGLLHQKIGGAAAPPASARPAPQAPVEFGMEEVGGGEIAIGEAVAPASAPAPTPMAAAPPPPAAAAVAPAAAPAAEAVGAEDDFFGLLDDIVDAEGEAEEPAAGGPPAAEAPAQNQLFAALSQEELQAVIARFRLLSFAPGDIVVSEGQPGESLFVLTTGSLRAWVRDQGGRNVPLRDLQEGSFFGEVSILSGKPRSATITCSSHAELLELDRAALDAIVAEFPRVKDVIRETYEARAGSLEEMLAREGWEGPEGRK
jgi:hypothetical protein